LHERALIAQLAPRSTETLGVVSSLHAWRAMPTHATLPLVDALTEEIAHRDRESERTVRSSAACIRALVDEVAHRHPSNPCVAALHDQLGEDASR
jgi:hypothetical protein